MKSVLSLVLLVFVLASCSKKDSPKTVLFGEFISSDSAKIPGEVYLKYTDHESIVYKQITFDTLKVIDRMYSAVYDLKEPLEFNISDDKGNDYFRKLIYLFPEDSLEVNVGIDSSGVSILHFGNGEKSLFNKVIHEIDHYTFSLARYYAFQNDRNELHISNDSLKQVRISQLNEYKSQLSLDEYQYLISVINADWAYNNIDNLLMTQYWKYGEDVVDTFDLYEYKSIDFNIEYNNLYPYKNLIIRLASLESSKVYAATYQDSGSINFRERLINEYENLKNNYTKIEKDILISSFISTSFKYIKKQKSFDIIDSLFKDYLSKNKSLFSEKLINYSKKIANILPGHRAPGLSQVDINGDTVNLSDLKGKVVYIDFWGLGCGPCMQEMNPAKKLEEKYKDEDDLVFMKISNSSKRNFQANLDYVIKEKLGGINIVTSDRVASKLFLVSGIPRYFIIDKNGNIANPNAPRPSDLEKLSTELDSLLSL